MKLLSFLFLFLGFNFFCPKADATELWECRHKSKGWLRYTNRAANSEHIRCRRVVKRFSYTKMPGGAFKGFLLPRDTFTRDDDSRAGPEAKRARGKLAGEKETLGE